ncbi:MAG: hypothetical protein AAF791_01790 [Bacteroidota bacterium]
MTQLLEKAIARLQALPVTGQDRFASRILAGIEAEQDAEAALLADLDEGIAAADMGDVRDGEAVMAELRENIKARL